MKLFKSFAVRSMAVALALALAPATLPAGAPLGIAQAQAEPFVGAGVHLVGGRHYGRRHYRGGRHYRVVAIVAAAHYRRHRGIDSGGAAVLGGIIGLGIGAAIASQPRYYDEPRPLYRVAPRGYAPAYGSGEWYRYCADKYRSFDPRSGTYQPYHGPRRVCR